MEKDTSLNARKGFLLGTFLYACTAYGSNDLATSNGSLPIILLSILLLFGLAAFGIWWRYLRLPVTWRGSLDGVRFELYRHPTTSLRKLAGDALIVPVGMDGWLGRCVVKAVRDQAGDAIQHLLREGGPYSPGEARAVAGGKLKARHIVGCCVFDELNRTNPKLLAKALDAAISEANRLGAREISFVDFSPVFAYSRDRTDEGALAREVVSAVLRNKTSVSVVRVLVPEHRFFLQWRAEARTLELPHSPEERTKDTEAAA